MTDTHQPGFAKLVSMIEALGVGMMTTQDGGHLRSRPMATLRAQDGVLWFLTSEDSPKVDEIDSESAVNLSYADPNTQTYVSVSGNAQTSQDRAKIRELWNDMAGRWFPNGPDDPKVALLKVEIEEAEYWDVDTRAMTRVMQEGGSGEKIAQATDHKKLS